MSVELVKQTSRSGFERAARDEAWRASELAMTVSAFEREVDLVAARLRADGIEVS
jgi:hypothetical protein